MQRFPALIAAIVLLPAQMAEAKVYRSLTNNNGTDLGTSLTDVKLTQAGATSTSFTLAQASRVAISFTATCASFTSVAMGYVQIDILVDGVARPPTNQLDDALCRSPGSEFRSITIGVQLAAGRHTVRIRGQAAAGAYAGELYDTSLVIFD